MDFISTDELESLFKQTNSIFLKRECNLILSGVSERCLCATIAGYFIEAIRSTVLQNYYVDVEYNRNDGKVKTIINGEMKVIPITCDLIIHSRGEQKKDNVLAIEMIKSTVLKSEKISDKERLIALTKSVDNNDIWSSDGTVHPEHVCGYDLGIYYEVNLGKRFVLIEYYIHGMKNSEEVVHF